MLKNTVKMKIKNKILERMMNMKFVKGVVIGGLLVTGAAMMYTEMGKTSKKKMMKKGRQMIRKMGIVQKIAYMNKQ